MALLGLQAGRGKDSLETVDYLDNPQGTLSSTRTRIKFFLCSIKKKQ